VKCSDVREKSLSSDYEGFDTVDEAEPICKGAFLHEARFSLAFISRPANNKERRVTGSSAKSEGTSKVPTNRKGRGHRVRLFSEPAWEIGSLISQVA
jgi:hypothetical protein